jgi:tetratricopeptide (TPR) repeat protein/peroxiredoxin
VSRSLDSAGASLDYELAWNAINELIRADYSWNGYERNVCFLNNRDGTFTDVSSLLGLDFEDDSRAFGLADFDGDGRLEIILKNRSTPQLRVLRNNMEQIGNSISFRLKGIRSNRDAIGASVTIEGSSMYQTRYLQAGSGFLSQHTKELFFGTGVADKSFRVTVQWPDGSRHSFENVPVNRRISIREGEAVFHATPYQTSRRRVQESSSPGPNSMLPDVFGTWLLEPLRAMPFALSDTAGQIWTLDKFANKPLLLLMTTSACQRSLQQLIAAQKHLGDLQSHSIGVLAINLDGSSDSLRALKQQAGIRFPLLLADKEATGVYSILYRYLFDRRRPLEPPVSFLIDKNTSIVKIYHGAADPLQICKDWVNAPTTEVERVHYAIGPRGQYHGGLPRRNYFTYGIAYIQGNHVDAAVTCFQEAIIRSPSYAAAYYNLGTIYLNKQMLPEARKSLEQAVSLDPQDADAWTNLGAIAGQQKNYDEALEYFQQAVKVNPTHLVALQNLVMLYRWQGKLDQAEQVLRNAIKREPNDAEFHFALGMLLAGQERFDDARSELERTTRLRPKDSTTLNNLGVVYLRLGRQDDALTIFERCVQISPDYDRPFLNIALVYQQAGKKQRAREILRAFAEHHPDNQEVAQALASLER